MERTDWLDEGLDPAQAQFLMVTAITHHRFSSPLWGEDEVRKLQSELAEIGECVEGRMRSQEALDLVHLSHERTTRAGGEG